MYTVIKRENEEWKVEGIAIKQIIEEERQRQEGKWINDICILNKNEIAIPHDGKPFSPKHTIE